MEWLRKNGAVLGPLLTAFLALSAYVGTQLGRITALELQNAQQEWHFEATDGRVTTLEKKRR